MLSALPTLRLIAGVISPPRSRCGQKPPLVPAMVDQRQRRRLFEAALAGVYAVTFVGRASAHGDPEQDYGIDGEKRRVAALALWRAAQLALEQGYPAFQVQSETSDADVTVVDPPGPPPYVLAPLRTISGPPCRWDCDRPIGYWGDPYFNPIYDEWYRRGHSSGRVTARLTVKLLPAATAGAEDAAQTDARLRAAYAAATFDVR
jgi:hypothetical protein